MTKERVGGTASKRRGDQGIIGSRPVRERVCVQQRVGGSHGTAADSQQRGPDVPLASEGVLERSFLCVSPVCDSTHSPHCPH